MANSLLDFVMSLVRDPGAAARYAADPGQAIADAQLVDVTTADVNNLIPMVAESLSMSTPVVGGEAFGAEPTGNVWASGAATAAFDAFDAFDERVPATGFDELPDAVLDEVPTIVTDVVDDGAEPAVLQLDELAPVVASPDESDVPVLPDLPTEFADDWPPIAEDAQPGDPGFDLLD